MQKQLLLLAQVFLTACSPALAATSANPAVPIPPASEILKTLKKEHPRLLASAQDFNRLKEQVASDPLLKKWHGQIRDQGEKILTDPPSKYEIPDGLRLLATSRRVLGRMETLGLLYKLEGDQRYVARAWQELEAAGNFQDWNPRHFLDTAEMTHAFALAYDWLYDAWTPEQREFIRNAMVSKGLQLGVDCYRGTARYGGWTRAHHNWNQVCNGGIGMGALALADERPDLAGEFLHNALISLQLPMAYFAPDGAWNEGPGYWHYATTYNIAILAALQTALGTDFGLSQMPGFSEAGMFPIQASGPFGLTFNYADAGQGPIRAPQLFWMATQFNKPGYAAWQLNAITRPHPLDLLWYRPVAGDAGLDSLPLNKYFRNAEVVTMRSAWNDPNATFVALKCGDNKANHSHLDLGSFVLDALGVRWAADIGSDDYNLPGYFGKQRWDYYRLRAEGHNTLLINQGAEPDQDPAAFARIQNFAPTAQKPFVVADLTPAYKKQAESVIRRVQMLEKGQVVVQDEIHAAKPADVWWCMHTAAKVTLLQNGTAALLTQGKARLFVKLGEPGALTLLDAEPLPTSPHPAKQGDNKKFKKLAVHTQNAKDLTIAVFMTPLREGEEIPSGTPPFELPARAVQY